MVLITHYAQKAKESVICRMELFMEHIKRTLDEMTDLQRRTGRPRRLGSLALDGSSALRGR